MSVGAELDEIAVFCQQRKTKLGFREGHPNREVMGDALVQVTLWGCCGSPHGQSLLQA